MHAKEWDRFFELLHQVVEQPGKSWKEKYDTIREEAAERSAEVDLDEFCGWIVDADATGQ